MKIREQIVLYLDNELNEVESLELLNTIRTKPEYMKWFKEEESFKKFIRNKATEHKVNPSLISSLKEKIKNKHL